MPSNRSLPLRALVVATTALMLGTNFAATSLPLFGRDTAEISDRFRVLVTPAGYVFSIWGLIYLGMIAYAAAQFIGPLRADELPDRLAPAIIASNIANSLWLVLWHALLIVLSVPVMLVLLGSLITAYVLARRDRPDPVAPVERWTVRAPLSLYLGWISVATIANISNALRAAEWNGLGVPEPAWAVIVLMTGAIIALLGVLTRGDLIFAGVFVWAYIGIAVEAPGPVVPLAAMALAALIAVGGFAMRVLLRQRTAVA